MPQRKPVLSLESLAMAALTRLVGRVGEAVTLTATAAFAGGGPVVGVRGLQQGVEEVVDWLQQLLYTATPATMHPDITDRHQP